MKRPRFVVFSFLIVAAAALLTGAKETQKSEGGEDAGMPLTGQEHLYTIAPATEDEHSATPSGEQGKPQTKCPVMGESIDPRLYVDKDGKRIYICCRMCRNKLEKNFDEYADKLKSEGVAVARAVNPQTACPVTGEKIDSKHYVEKNGKRIYACCPDCPARIEKDFETYARKLESEGVTLEKVVNPQTKCPVTGEKVNAKAFVEKDGKRIHACCPACLPRIEREFDQMVEKLESEGYTLEAPPQPQAFCPIMGEKINPKVFVEQDGKRIYACCADCVPQIKKQFDAYAKKLRSEGVDLKAEQKGEGEKEAPDAGMKM